MGTLAIFNTTPLSVRVGVNQQSNWLSIKASSARYDYVPYYTEIVWDQQVSNKPGTWGNINLLFIDMPQSAGGPGVVIYQALATPQWAKTTALLCLYIQTDRVFFAQNGSTHSSFISPSAG